MSTVTAGLMRPTIPILDAEDVKRNSDRALAEARRRMSQIEELPLESVTAATILDAWDQASIVIEDAFGAISLLNSVHPDSQVRDAADVVIQMHDGRLLDL